MNTQRSVSQLAPEPVLTVVERCNRGDYRCTLPLNAPRADWAQQMSQLNARFVADLEAEYCVQTWPGEVRTKLFAMAWDMGHSAGHAEVAHYYDALHELAQIAYEAGREQAVGRAP
jgi:hypothetical protein